LSDYRDALQSPARAFRSPDLQACHAETNRTGVPRARAGAFANVFKLIRPDQSATALKVFLYPNPQRMERYQAVSDHLDGLARQNRSPACLVRCHYDPEGLRVRGRWFPIQTMDWVTGQGLRPWVEERSLAGDGAALRDLAGRWAAALRDLRQADVAHGDLMHDNVLVVGGGPVLVDYDCLTVPALVGRDASEDGHPAYQHPGRRGRKLSLDLDHFGAWVIWLALRALAVDPSLFQKHVAARKAEGVLFTAADVQRPGLSPVWGDLLASADAEVRQWADRLRGAVGRPFEQVPPFAPPG
jgi:hypothetical protein